MERLVQHLQQVANHHDLAQLHQWLCTYMLYVQSATSPTLEVVPHVPSISLLGGLHWKGLHLMVSDRALQEVPAQHLALLAVRGHLEAQARRRLTRRSILLTFLVLLTIPPLIYLLAPPTHDKVHWMFHLLVIVPIERVWAWRHSIARRIDREIVQSTGETEVFLQALTTVIKADIKIKGMDKDVKELIGRLNSLCKENGYPEVTMEELIPPPPPQDDGQAEPPRPAVVKGEFLLRHPPNEHNTADKARIYYQPMENTQINQQSFPEYPVLESNHPFVQWLHTYLLWANIMGVNPMVFTFPSYGEPSVEHSLRWRKNVLWVGNDLLERMPPRLLAILAVRNYMEQQTWHSYLMLVVLALVVALMITLAVTDYIRRLLGVNPLWDLVPLFVVPVLLNVPSFLRDLARRRTDEEVFERLGEPQMFLLAMQTALEESYRQGETDEQIQKMLQRLNRLRTKVGDPPLTLQEVKQKAGEPLATTEEPQEESPIAVNNGTEEEEQAE